MIKELINHMKEYDEKRNVIEKSFEATVKELDKTYVHTSVQYQDKLAEAMKIRDNAEKEITVHLQSMVDSAFKAANTKLEAYVTAEVPDRVANVLDRIQQLGNKITKQEAVIYENLMKQNYIAHRVAAPMLAAITQSPNTFLIYDDVKEHLDNMENRVRNWINNYDPNTYSHAIMISEQNNGLAECEEMLTAFLNGEV